MHLFYQLVVSYKPRYNIISMPTWELVTYKSTKNALEMLNIELWDMSVTAPVLPTPTTISRAAPSTILPTIYLIACVILCLFTRLWSWIILGCLCFAPIDYLSAWFLHVPLNCLEKHLNGLQQCIIMYKTLKRLPLMYSLLFSPRIWSLCQTEVSDELLTIKQGSRKASDYELEFHILTAGSKWNEVSLQTVYCQGLNAHILKELVCRDMAMSLDSLIDHSIQLDNLSWDRLNDTEAALHNPSFPFPKMYQNSCNWAEHVLIWMKTAQ